MDRPEPDMPATDRSASNAAPADSWGEKEVAREIALLEAHLSEERISRAIENAFAAVEGFADSTRSGGLTKEILLVNLEDEIHQSYLDYAMAVIVGRALPCGKAIRAIQNLSQRAMALFPYLSHGLTAALAIHRLTSADKACSALLLKLRKSAESALYGLPLFAYGPELSEFRHRIR
jgi:hypothetical protein